MDFQITEYVDAVNITDAQDLGITPRTLVLKGADLDKATEVTMNGQASPNIYPLERGVLAAEVPTSLRDETIRDINAYARSTTLGRSSLIELSVGGTTSGLTYLVQTFVRHLMRLPGSNRFHPGSGGGVLANIAVNQDELSSADVALAVGRAQDYILANQDETRRPKSELLLSAKLVTMVRHQDGRNISVVIELVSLDGQTTSAALQGTG